MVTYIDSIMSGSDASIIPALVRFYLKKEQPLILDATYGKGRFWFKSDFRFLTGMDNRHTSFANESFEAIVYDPPHIYRKVEVDDLRQSVIAFYNLPTAQQGHRPFLEEAMRLLKPGGFVIAKISDEVAGKGLWNHVVLLNTAIDVGFLPFDFIIKHRHRSIRNPAQQRHRARKCHCFYVILKKVAIKKRKD